MPRSIVLISCVSGKRNHPTKAKDLYDSLLFRTQREYAEKFSDLWFILSAEHYLLDPEKIVAPYEKSLKGAGVKTQRIWSQHVFDQLIEFIDPADKIIVTAGEDYCRFLVPKLESRGHKVIKPLKGLRQGERPPRLRQLVKDASII